MLVLSRRTRDSIMIGHQIVVTVLSIGRDQVRLGIDAPPDVEVHREEVYRSIQQANRAAATSAGDIAQLAQVRTGSKAEHRSQRPVVPDPSRPGARAGDGQLDVPRIGVVSDAQTAPGTASGPVVPGTVSAPGDAPAHDLHEAERPPAPDNGTATP